MLSLVHPRTDPPQRCNVKEVPEAVKERVGVTELHDLQIEQCGVGILVDSGVRVLFKNLHVLNCRIGMLVGSRAESAVSQLRCAAAPSQTSFEKEQKDKNSDLPAGHLTFFRGAFS